MCGIAGIAGKKDEVSVQSMLRATAHRGPDDSGMYADALCTLGHNRLSIIDLSAAGHQPMLSPDERHVMVYNGEIYNYKTRRKELEQHGVTFKSQTDSEVVLQLYIKHGANCVNYLRGMFAFAIWDTQEKTLFAARDRHGIKPFYYSYQNSILQFCSEIKGLVAGGNADLTLNPIAIQQFLTKGCVYPPNTFYKDIKSLLPGQSLIWQNGKMSIADFTQSPSVETAENVSYGEAVQQVYSYLHESTEEQMVSDVPLGIFLSGGLDSSVLTCAAKKFKNQLDTFSIGFEGKNKRIDESNEATISAKYFGTTHHQLTVSDSDIARHIAQFIHTIDQPSLDGINSYFISYYSSSSVTVALSGLGGDELFMGYSSQQFLLNHTTQKPIGHTALKTSWKILPEYLKRRWEIDYCAGNLKKLYAIVNRVFTPQEINQILQTREDVLDTFADSLNAYQLNTKSPEKQISLMDQYLFMGARLREIDVTGMAWSMETRFPLLDERLTNYLMTLPPSYLMNGKGDTSQTYEKGNVKKLLYDAFKKELPADFTTRNKKGFEMPFHSWLSEAISGIVKEEFNNLHPVFKNKDFLMSLLEEEMKQGGWIKNWSIFVLNFWLRKNFKEQSNN